MRPLRGGEQGPDGGRRLKALEEQVTLIEDELKRTQQMIGQLLTAAGLAVPDAPDPEVDENAQAEIDPTVDMFWFCVKCHTKLGIYDTRADVLRIRSKTMIAYFRPGTGGGVSIVCGSCSELNVVDYTEEAPDPQGTRIDLG